MIRDVRAEQARSGDWASGSSGVWTDPRRLLDHLRERTYLLDAAEAFDWDSVLRPGATVLDLGCGSGWLSALLSRRADVARVIAWDSSPTLLERVMPAVVEMLGGDEDKVSRVCGDFTPLLLDDDSVDLVAMSSAFHHSTRPDDLLEDIARVLRPGAAAVLLNETPWRRLAMANFAARTSALAALNLLSRDRIRRGRGELSAAHALYDPRLGDRAYTLAQWHDLARRHGFALETVDAGVPSYKPVERRRTLLEGNLTHLILRPGDRSPGARVMAKVEPTRA